VGLPPGPIRMPEGRTIDALLNSKPHPYLYMCAKEDFSGKHNFAIDLATHQRNATRYQAALNRRKIK
ncbi:MAG: endolytic transglycosylase MltG, partial [Muribaculaceae bacterium]|nr:endolytic transglycosylase MltG [Muribaculaceae bacterium]